MNAVPFNARVRREKVVVLLKGESIEIEDAAKKLGLSSRQVKDCWEKNWEIEIASRFLNELGEPTTEVLTLKEFLGVERDSRTNIDLDDVCPDVVARIADAAIGIELTAYADNESHNRLSANMYRASEVVRKELADNYPELCDFMLDYSPNKDNVLPLKRIRDFVEQLLSFARDQHRNQSLAPGEYRRLPRPYDRVQRNTFEDYDILRQHVTAVSIARYQSDYAIPVSVAPGGFSTHFGTSVDHILQRIKAKTISLSKACLDGQNEPWLLIHATGSAASSIIPALFPEEIQKMLASAIPQAAKQSGFNRVILWDGLHGGFIDFVTGEVREYQMR